MIEATHSAGALVVDAIYAGNVAASANVVAAVAPLVASARSTMFAVRCP